MMRIQTARLTLRCLEPGDAPAHLEALAGSRKHLERFLPRLAEGEPTLARSQRVVERLRRWFETGEQWHFGIFERAGGRLAGVVSLVPKADDRCEIGYWLRADSCGRGFASEAVAALARAAVEEGGFRRLEIHTERANRRSAKVARRVGFTRCTNIRGHLERWSLAA